MIRLGEICARYWPLIERKKRMYEYFVVSQQQRGVLRF